MTIERCPLLLLPGSLCDARLFGPQLARPRSRKVVVGDVTTADSIQAIAAHVLGTAPPRFAVAGLSMGAIVAFEIWRQAPSRVAGLAVFDSTHKAESSHVAARRAAEIELVRRDGTAGLRRLLLETYVPVFFHRTSRALTERMLQMAASSGPGVLERQWRALMSRPDSLATLRTVDVPALVARGADDRMCSAALHEEMSTALGVACHTIDHCGHLPSLEAPARTAALLHGWLTRVDANERVDDDDRQAVAC